jgi:hypothetical protein
MRVMLASDPQVCAFCARPRSQVKNLVAGDGLGHASVGICESCVSTSYDILVERGALAPEPAAAPASMDASSAIRAAVRAVPRSADVKVFHDLASAGIGLAGGDAATLRILAYDLGNAMAFEEAIRVRAGIASFERNVADALSEAAYQTRIANPREGVAVLDRLGKGPLASKVTPAEGAGVSMARMYAQLGALPWDNDVRAIETELETLVPRLPNLGLDANFLRALQNQAVHIRARAAMAQHRDRDAVAQLTAQLAERELDIEALVLVVEAYERTGDRTSAARAREKASKHMPVNSAYAKRLSASGR